jgi:hypothetical protein
MRRETKSAKPRRGAAKPSIKAFVFVPRFVCPGDILLTRVPLNLLDTSTFNSTAIQAVTGAPFSHAALCIEPGLLIEAIGTGVCRLALGQTGARSNKNVKLLRLNLDVPNGPVFAQRAADFGHQYLSRGYSISGAVGARISALRKDRGDLFCSELVARAYLEAGCPLLTGKSPGEIAPGDILKSDVLRDVTKLALAPVTLDRPLAFYLDDGSHFERPVHWEVKTKLEILRSEPVRRELNAVGCNPESFFELEKVLRTSASPNLDVAVHSELVRQSFKQEYLQRTFSSIGVQDPTDVFKSEFATRFRPPEEELKACNAETLRFLILDTESSIISFQNDIRSRIEDIQKWRSYLTDNNEKTFKYLETMQIELRRISDRMLALFKQQEQHLKGEEARRTPTGA